MEHKNDLTYSVGEADEARLDIIDMKVSDNSRIALTAKLNEDLVNIMEKYSDTDDLDLLIAYMHGLVTIAGTILVNTPEKEQSGTSEEIKRLVNKRLENLNDVLEI